MVDTDLIDTYFQLERRIKNAECRKKKLRTEFYEGQTLSSYVTSDGLEIIAQGFNIERNAIPYMDMQAELDTFIEVANFKNIHFKRYLSGLPKSERLYLKSRYMRHRECLNDRVDRETLEELAEIETAVKYRFFGNKEISYFEAGEIETDESEKQFESFFSNMCGLLGVTQ